MLDEQEFHRFADDVLTKLHRKLSEAADDYGFEADFTSGAISIEFEDPPARFVISPNSPVRQIWVSAHAKSYKLDWDEVNRTFVLGGSGKTLTDLMEEAIGKQLGETVNL
jgi:CyaY protein